MHFENPEIYDKMKSVCEKLNLKSHKSGMSPLPDDPDMWGPGDIEGHVGHDSRLYILDYARVFPPECPLPNQIMEKGSLFFKLLRPELVRSNKVPLSSDSLTRWGMGDPNKNIHNREVLDATLRLRQEIIPDFSVELTSEFGVSLTASPEKAIKLYSESLSHRLHSAGINLRHLGLVRRAVKNPYLKSLLLVEMIARVFKCKLNEKLRRAITSDIGVAFEKCRAIVASTLDLCMRAGERERSLKFWNAKLKNILEVKFTGGLSEEEKAEQFDLWTLVEPQDVTWIRYPIRAALLSRFLALTGTHLSEHALTSFKDDSEPAGCISGDITSLVPRIKNMVIGDLSFAFSKYMHALRLIGANSPNLRVAGRLLDLVLLSLKRAPQFSALFHEKLLTSSIGGLFAKYTGTEADSITTTLSNILDATITLSLSQRPRLSKSDYTEALALEYVKASRILRQSRSTRNSEWMMARASALGVALPDVALEMWRIKVHSIFD